MDLEFVELEHRENILKLMEICGIEMKEAYDLYVQAGYNFEAAVSRKFNQHNNIPEVPPLNAFNPQQAAYHNPAPYFQNQFMEDDDPKYAEYKQFMRSGKSFTSKYPVRKHQGFFERIIPSFFKKEAQDPFKARLEKYVQKRVNLKNTVGNLSEVLEWSWKEKYPALIMILDFLPQNKQEVKKIFSQQSFIEQVLNQQYKLYGINALDYNLETQLKHLFNLSRDVNQFIVCRVNHLEEVEIMHRIKVTEPYEEIKKKLKLVKSECIQQEMEEGNIIKQYQEEKKGNFNYRRPRTIKENIKYKEDKKIRKQQQEEFFKACVPKKQEEKPQNEQNQSKPQKKVEQKQQIKSDKPEVKPKEPEISQQKLKQIRQQKFSTLKKYESGLTFKIRVPSGQNIILSVDRQENVQYLFDYITYLPNDLGFIDDNVRNFDIFVNFGGSQSLKGKQKEYLKNLFEDSQVLIVREIRQ